MVLLLLLKIAQKFLGLRGIPLRKLWLGWNPSRKCAFHEKHDSI